MQSGSPLIIKISNHYSTPRVKGTILELAVAFFFSIYCNDGRILYSTRISWDVPHVNTLYKLIFLTQKSRIFTGINFYRSLSLRQNTCLFLNSIIEKNCKNQETIWNESSTNHCHRWFHSQIFAGWRPKIVIFSSHTDCWSLLPL